MAFVVVIPVAAWLAYRYNRRIEETQVLSVFLSMMILVVAGAAGSFKMGAGAIVALNIVAFLACVIGLVRDRKRMLQAVVTPGAAAYLVLCILMFIACYGRFISNSDEFTYWAPMIRGYYLNDRFGASMRYLEISAVWDYLATRMWLRCSTGMMALGHATMIIAYLIPVYSDCKGKVARKSVVRWLLLTVMIWMLPMFGAGQFHSYVSLYADMFLGAGTIYTLVSFIRYREQHARFYYVSMLVGLASVVLAKQAGLILGAILLFVMAGTSLAANPAQDRKGWTRDAIGVALAFIAAAAVAVGVSAVIGGGGAYAMYITQALHYWPLLVIALVIVIAWIILFIRVGSRFLLTIPFVGAFAGAMVGMTILGLELNLHQVGQVVYATCKTFMDYGSSHVGWFCHISDYMLLNLVFVIGALAEILVYGRQHLRESLPALAVLTAELAAICLMLNQLHATEEFSAITFVLTALLIVVEAILLVRYLRGRKVWFAEQKDGSAHFWLFYFLVIGCVLYMLFYLSGMLIAFGEPEENNSAQTARSLWRYMYSYMAPPLFVMGYLVLRKDDKDYIGGFNPFWCVFVIILLDADLVTGVQQLYDRPQAINFTGMAGYSFGADDMVCVVDMNIDNEPNLIGGYNYLYFDGHAEYAQRVFCNNWFENDELYGERMTPEEVGEMLIDQECDYVYLRYADMERGFAEFYADLFTDSAEISTDRLYRVVTMDNGSVMLEYMPRQVD